MDCYFFRERVESKENILNKVATKDQVADMFTKAISRARLKFLLDKLDILDIHAPP